MKTDYSAATVLAKLAKIAPSVSFKTTWEPDQDAKWDVEDPSLDANDFQAWQSDVCASVIAGGKLHEGHAYLGGTWEKFGDDPAKSNPDISGYLLQMLDEAAEELRASLSETDSPVLTELERARTYLSDTMQARYIAESRR